MAASNAPARSSTSTPNASTSSPWPPRPSPATSADHPAGRASYEFAIQGGKPLSESVIEYYVNGFLDPESLRGCFGFYRAWDATIAQNAERATRPLTMPVLAIGGADSWGDHVREGMQPTATDVQGAVIAGAGHWVAEQAPEELLTALTAFLSD